MAEKAIERRKTPSEIVRDDVRSIHRAGTIRMGQIVLTSIAAATGSACLGMITWGLTYIADIKKEGIDRDKQLAVLIAQERNDSAFLVTKVDSIQHSLDEYKRTNDASIESLRSKYEELNVQIRIMVAQWQTQNTKPKGP